MKSRAVEQFLCFLCLATSACGTPPTYDPVRLPQNPEPPRLDLSGRWVGYAIQRPAGYAFGPYPPMEIPVIFELTQTQTGAKIEGTQRSSDTFGTDSAQTEVGGLVSGDTFFLEARRFLGEPGRYCLISAVLRQQEDAMGRRLTGEFVRSSQPGACPATLRGYLVLEPGLTAGVQP